MGRETDGQGDRKTERLGPGSKDGNTDTWQGVGTRFPTSLVAKGLGNTQMWGFSGLKPGKSRYPVHRDALVSSVDWVTALGHQIPWIPRPLGIIHRLLRYLCPSSQTLPAGPLPGNHAVCHLSTANSQMLPN